MLVSGGFCPHFTGEARTEMIFFFFQSLRARSEQGNFCLLGLFAGSLFVLTQVNNRFLTEGDKLQLIMFCSGNSSFFSRTVHIT